MNESLSIEQANDHRQLQVMGDYKPTESTDPAANILARVYAQILSWPAIEMWEIVEEEIGK